MTNAPESAPQKWQPVKILGLYLAAVFGGGALLAPWLYWLVQWLDPGQGWWHGLTSNPFHRYVHRCLLVLALAGLYPLMRGFGLRSWSDAGLVAWRGQWPRLSAGFAFGFGSLALAAALTIAGGVRWVDWGHTVQEWTGFFLKTVATALIVATLEELLFRGALFGALRKTLSWKGALLVSSFIYALVHFFQKPAPPAPIEWYTGFLMLGGMLRGFLEIETLAPGLFSLMLVGMTLAFAYHKTGNLYFSIGLHAGWIFWLKFFGFLTRTARPEHVWFWGSNKLIDGWLALIVLAATAWCCVQYARGVRMEAADER